MPSPEIGTLIDALVEQVVAFRSGLSTVGQVYDARYALDAALDQQAKDAERLDWLADEPIVDGLGGMDLHEEAARLVDFAEVSEPESKAAYRQAFRILIDAARAGAHTEQEGKT